MDKRSSSAIGEEFELRTKSVIESLLVNSELKLKVEGKSEFWIVPKDSHTFHHKKYKYCYGDKTDTDISIEGPSTGNKPNFIIVIECKCYTRKVEIGEIQEFVTRVRDLKATKGIFITSNDYQRGALNCAESNNIALVRINSDNEANWLLYRTIGHKENNYLDYVNALLQPDMIYRSVIVDGWNYSISFSDYILNLLNIEDRKLHDIIPYLTDEEIKIKAKAFLGNKAYNKVPDTLLKFYAIKERILIDDNHLLNGFLGKCDFLNRKVSVDNSLLKEDVFRYRFTLAHELGHAYLHQPILHHVVSEAHDNDVLELKNCSKWEKRLEIQANHFTAFLLMPQNTLLNLYMEVKSNLNYPLHAPLRMDDNRNSIHDCKVMFRVLSEYFGVSKQVAMIRLIDENLIDIGVNNPFTDKKDDIPLISDFIGI